MMYDGDTAIHRSCLTIILLSSHLACGKGACPTNADKAAGTARTPTSTHVSFTGEHVHQYLSERSPHETVDEEVYARVECQEEIANYVDRPQQGDREGETGEEYVQ